MIEERAHVVAVDADCALVETERRSSCQACAANKGCGTATLAKVLGQRRTRVRVLNAFGARVGDEVVVGIAEQALVRGSLAVYIVPLFAMMGAALLGGAMGRNLGFEGEATAVLCGIAGLVGGLLWLRGYARGIARDPRYQPVVLRRVGQLATPGAAQGYRADVI